MLNLLRYLGNELRIPLTCLGTREAYLAIRTDDQLENRFEPFSASGLGGWPGVRPSACKFLKLSYRYASRPVWVCPAMRAMILQRSEGTIGEVAALLAAATETALASGQEQIDAASVEAAEYQPPTVRRRMFERRLR